VLAPGDGSDPVQLIDVRDLAEWTIRLAEMRTTGTFNATGPRQPLAMRDLLVRTATAIARDADLRWTPADLLEANQVRPWSDLPVWVPGHGETAGFARRGIARAVQAGLTFRPIETTAVDTLAWFRAQAPERQAALRAGLAADREADVLARRRQAPP